MQVIVPDLELDDLEMVDQVRAYDLVFSAIHIKIKLKLYNMIQRELKKTAGDFCSAFPSICLSVTSCSDV